MQTIVILHDIRSAENVGSIFRTSDAAGVSEIYLTGYTPAPLDKFKRANSKIAKAALGAESSVKWHSEKDIKEVINKLKEEGFQVVAVEQDKNPVDYKKFQPTEKTAFIFGNEVEGLPKEVIELSDEIIEIPMKGQKESLNVAVTAGIVLFQY